MTLQFHVCGQILRWGNPRRLVADSRNYLQAQFCFPGDWPAGRTAVFTGRSGTVYQVLLDEDRCAVPPEVISAPYFTLSVFAGDRMTANVLEVPIEPSGLKEGIAPPPVTPDIYSQLVAKVEQEADKAAASAQTAADQAQAAGASAGTALDNAQTAAQLREETAADMAAAGTSAQSARESAQDAQEQCLLAAYYAKQAQSALSQVPMRYYRFSEEEMEAIESPQSGALCYVIDFSAGRTALYVYDTTDMDGDGTDPEWVFLGYMEFTSLDRDSLLAVLQLAPVALSGQYADLQGKPARYQTPLVLDGSGESIPWNVSQSDNAVVSISGSKPLALSGLYPGCEGHIEVFGGLLDIPDGEKSPTFDYLSPLSGQEHLAYAFFSRDGIHCQWVAMPFEGASL